MGRCTAKLVWSGRFPEGSEVLETDWEGQGGSWTLASAHTLHLPLITCPGILESLREVQKVPEGFPGTVSGSVGARMKGMVEV